MYCEILATVNAGQGSSGTTKFTELDELDELDDCCDELDDDTLELDTLDELDDSTDDDTLELDDAIGVGVGVGVEPTGPELPPLPPQAVNSAIEKHRTKKQKLRMLHSKFEYRNLLPCFNYVKNNI